MTARNEQIEAKVKTRKAKKRWAAPEVTRLEFPKTAAASAHISGDSISSSIGS